MRMSSIQSNPRITTLSRKGSGRWEHWTILAENPTDGYTALREINEAGSVAEITERVRLVGRLEMDTFCNKLETEGWDQHRTPSRYNQLRTNR